MRHRIVIEVELVISVRGQEPEYTHRTQSWCESSSRGISISKTHGLSESGSSLQKTESINNPNPDQR